jgi:hypothetical protein
MNSNEGWHPSWEELCAFDHALLSDRAWQKIADHVAICDACCLRLDDLPEDDLERLLRAAWKRRQSPGRQLNA